MLTYFALDKDEKLIKIGRATNINQRFSALKCSNPDLKLVGLLLEDKEKYLHGLFKSKNYKLEWFYYDEEIKNYIIKNAVSLNSYNKIKKYLKINNKKIDKTIKPLKTKDKEIQIHKVVKYLLQTSNKNVMSLYKEIGIPRSSLYALTVKNKGNKYSVENLKKVSIYFNIDIETLFYGYEE